MKVINLHQEEQQTIRLAVENNRQAQQRIYSQFAPKMLSVCRQYIKDLQHAEDIMITSFMKVFTNLKNFEKRQNPLWGASSTTQPTIVFQTTVSLHQE